MKFFQRQAKPNYSTKVIATPELKADPITPILETIIQPVKICAHCGAEGAEHQYTGGDMYLKTLPFTFFCDKCWEQRQWLVQHPIARQHTRQEHAIPARPRKRVQQMPAEAGRTPSRPLEDRAYNLASGG